VTSIIVCILCNDRHPSICY